jgi:hypothetical protein
MGSTYPVQATRETKSEWPPVSCLPSFWRRAGERRPFVRLEAVGACFAGLPWVHGPLFPSTLKAVAHGRVPIFKISKEKVPQKVQEAKGVVAIDGRNVLFDVEYKGENGHWRRPPINGRRKISGIYPDDLPGKITKPLTK